MRVGIWPSNLLICLVLVTSAYGQSVAGLGGLTGIVTDESGARVPDAAVTVTNEQKGIRRELKSNQTGLFTVASLVPDPAYSVVIAKEGFQQFTARNIEILVGQVVDIRATLKVSGAATEVTVLDSAPIVDSTKTGVSQVVESDQIENLPINGRRVDSFVLLTPGVTNDGTFGLVSFRGIPGGNAFLTDGNDTTNQFYNENAGRTRISANISQDAVQEFQVVSSSPSAEFGRASGGVVNTVTRSGGNAVHGAGYWYYRDRNFNARDRYATFNPEERRQQFGGSLGGPIRKDRLFYFTNAEVTRRHFPLVSRHTFSPLFNTAGVFIAPCNATPAQCDAARRFVDRFNTVIPREANQELFFAKLDWRPADNHSLSASFNYLRWLSPNGIQTGATLTNGAAFGSNGLSTVRNRKARLAWTGVISPTQVNEFRFGWFKDRQYDALNPDILPPGGFMGSLTVDGVTNLGTPNYLPRVQPTEDRFQFADNFTWNINRHILKLGADTAHARDVTDQMINQRGTYVYPNFTAFAQDFSGNTAGLKRWQSYSQTFGDPLFTLWIRDYNFYVQDQFRATSRLTLNYGIRYELAAFTQPAAAIARYPATGRIPEPKKNFAPRLGIAYSLFEGKTVLRAGYGLYYSRYPGALLNNLNIASSGQRSINLQASRPADLAAGPVWPSALPGLGSLAGAGATSLSMASENMRTPYTQQLDLSVEQRLSTHAALGVSYLTSRGRRFLAIRDANLGPPGGSFTYRILDASGNQTATYTTPTYLFANRIDRAYQRINTIESVANIWYDAMVVQLRNRGLKAGPVSTFGTIAYTWAHTIDENLGGASNNLFFSGGPGTVFNGDFRGEKGSSSLDQRHRLVIGHAANLRLKNEPNAFFRYVVNNWQLSALMTFASSQATTPTVTVSGTQFPGAAFTSTLNGSGGSNRVPFLPRSSLDIDTIGRVDARLTKILPIGERCRLNLIFEGFNVFNNVSDTARRNQLYRAQAGVLRPLPDYGTGSASAGFPDGTNARRLQVSARFSF